MSPWSLLYLVNIGIGAYGLWKEFQQMRLRRRGVVCIIMHKAEDDDCPHKFPAEPSRWCPNCRKSNGFPGEGDPGSRFNGN